MIFFAIATVPLAVMTAAASERETNERDTRDLTLDQASLVLAQDWLFQAGERPNYEVALQEIARARQIAARVQKRDETPDLSCELCELARLEKELHTRSIEAGQDAPTRELYLAVRRVKRRIMLKSPEIDFSRVLFIDQPYPRFPDDRPWPYDRRGGQICRHENSHRNGMMAVPGGKLVVLDGLAPWGTQKQLGPQVSGSFWRPDLSFDASKAVFCFKPHDEKAFHLYEVDMDGRNLRQLTFGHYDDMDPIYLPDGHVMFATTRCHTYVRCVPDGNAYVLARCDGDGKNVYIISRSNECDWLPALLDDGRVIYSRWEYTDKPLWRIQSLWTTNPDGTNTAIFWGNQSVWPDHLAEPRPIPGTHRVMFTGLGHHDWFAGSIGIIDPRAGREFPHGLTKVTSNIPWPEVGNGPVDPVESLKYVPPGAYEAFKTPFPLSEDLFIVSARRGQGDDKFRLYLMDVHGNCELIYEGNHNVWHAMPMRPRNCPPMQTDRVAWPGKVNERRPVDPGMLYSPDLYEGVPDLPRGTVKYLRVFQQDHTTCSTGAQTFRWSGPGISIVQEDGVKRIRSGAASC